LYVNPRIREPSPREFSIMCGRFTLRAPAAAVVKKLCLFSMPGYRPSDNPTPAVTSTGPPPFIQPYVMGAQGWLGKTNTARSIDRADSRHGHYGRGCKALTPHPIEPDYCKRIAEFRSISTLYKVKMAKPRSKKSTGAFFGRDQNGAAWGMPPLVQVHLLRACTRARQYP